MEMSNLGKASGFILLYIFGVMMLKVIMRYRIYKEVYWNTCKTIAQLYDIQSKKINKQLVQHIFFRTLEKNASSVIIFKDKKSQKVDFLKSYRRVQNSAETTLYNILVFMSSIALWIGIYIGCNRVLGDHFLGKIVISTALVSLNYFSWKCFYYYKLKEVYGVVIDRKDKSFNLTYGKAWFLHGFYE